MFTWVARQRRRAGFTLLELIVTIVVLAVLAALVIVGYTAYTERAQVSRVKANLHQIAVATLAQATAAGAGQLDRDQVKAALASSDQQVVDQVSAGATLTLLASSAPPTGPAQVSVAFDNGDGTPTSDTSGTRLWLASATPSGAVYSQLVTYGSLGCSASWPAGTAAGSARSCTSTSTPAAPAGPKTVSGWPVAISPQCSGLAGAQPANGTVSTAADGSVRYVPNDSFVGTDTISCGGGTTVTVIVDPIVSCTSTPANTWMPAGTEPSATCPVDSVGETPTPPDNGSGQIAVPVSAMTVTALASYPHSDLHYPHVVYATVAGGGLIWVQDTGDTGTTNPSGQAGCAGSAPTCTWGWLSPSGTYTNPRAALTGEGPNHGTVPARFTIDSMFVADDNGIWVSRVNAFVHGTAPAKVVDATAYSGKVVALTGYTCYSGSTPVAGNCLWFVTDAGQLGQVNVDTGAVSATWMNVPYTGNGWWGTPKFVTAQSDAAGAYLLVGDQYGNMATFTPDGTLRSSSYATPALSAPTYASVDGKLAVGSGADTIALGSTPTGGTWTAPTGSPVVGTPTAMHSHGVPGSMYYATTAPGPCVYRLTTSGGATHTLWCDSRMPTTMPQMLTAVPAGHDDEFGYRMAVSGTTLVIGAYNYQNNGYPTGAAYIYNKVGSTWQLAKTITDPTGNAGNIGQSVTTNGSTVVISGSGVGCIGSSPDSGCDPWQPGALVYTRNGSDWNLTNTLTNPDVNSYASSVQLRGTTLFVGSPGDVHDPNRAWNARFQGAVYVLKQSGTDWVQQARLVAPDDLWTSSPSNGFGNTVAASDDGSEIAVPVSVARSGKGVVYEFTGSGSTWTPTIVENPDPTAFTGFGVAAAIDAKTLVVKVEGNNRYTGTAADDTSFLVFAGSGATWAKTAELGSGWPAGNMWEGDVVAVHGDTMAVGFWNDYNDALNEGGSVMLLKNVAGTWKTIDSLWEPNPAHDGSFGTAVAFDAGDLLISDYSSYPNPGDYSTYNGAVFAYSWAH